MKTYDPKGAERRKRTFIRRNVAAAGGTHFPTNDELLRGMSFFCLGVGTDAGEFVRRTLPKFSADIEGRDHALKVFKSLTVFADLDATRIVDEEFAKLETSGCLVQKDATLVKNVRKRLRFYSANRRLWPFLRHADAPFHHRLWFGLFRKLLVFCDFWAALAATYALLYSFRDACRKMAR